jgi:FixJ family two-component response regulator
LPVIFFVGGGDKSQKLTVLEAGAFAYLERPAEEAALIQVIKAALADGKTAPGGKAERQSPAKEHGSIRR